MLACHVRRLEQAHAVVMADRAADARRRLEPITPDRVVQALYEGVGKLRTYPDSGRPGREQGTRELVYPNLPYLAVYDVRDDVVRILTILHGRQRWPR